MEKRILLLLIIPVALISACGCTSSNSANPNGSQTITSATVLVEQETTILTPAQPSIVANAASHAQASLSVEPYAEATKTSPSVQATKTPAQKPAYATLTPTPAASTNGPFYGCTACGIYHYPSCSEVSHILPANLRIFASSAEARAAGLHPCSVCNPL